MLSDKGRGEEEGGQELGDEGSFVQSPKGARGKGSRKLSLHAKRNVKFSLLSRSSELINQKRYRSHLRVYFLPYSPSRARTGPILIYSTLEVRTTLRIKIINVIVSFIIRK